MSPDEISEYLNVHADARSDPGLIIPEDSAVKLDIEASVEAAASESFTTTAVTEPETKDVEVLIGIPAYNEANAIADVVTEAQNYADEVLVVDDASQDETAELARDAGATVVEHGSNKGYGGALKTVFEEADIRDADHLSILDGDGQHDPSDVPAAVRTQKADDVDIVIGSRFVDGSETDLPLYRRVGLTVVNVLTNVSMGVIRRKSWVNDTQSGFRTYNRHAIESLSEDDSIGEEMSASTDILYHAHEHGYDFEEIGTTIDYDVEDPSSHNPVSHGLTLVGNILTTIERKRPILILGVPGFLSSFVGLGFVYWTLSNYISSGTFPLGLATTSGFLILVGIFTCFTAIILHSLNTHLPE
ncbi:glycosyltransferase [Halorubrum sp. CBA1125]|nr:glycosyltransferase [Halorubrum sp. CBA1125]